MGVFGCRIEVASYILAKEMQTEQIVFSKKKFGYAVRVDAKNL
jgi:hypothetical protein